MRILSMVISFLSLAATKPEPRESFSHLILERDAERFVVRTGAELTLIMGSKLRLIAAFNQAGAPLSAPFSLAPRANHLVPHWRPKGLAATLDSGQPWAQYAIAGKEELDLAFDMLSRGQKLGSVGIKLVKPELKYALCEINNEVKVLRPFEVFRMKKEDLFRLTKVVTNFGDDHPDTGFHLEPLGSIREFPGTQFFEMRFSRGKQIFARVPVELEAQ